MTGGWESQLLSISVLTKTVLGQERGGRGFSDLRRYCRQRDVYVRMIVMTKMMVVVINMQAPSALGQVS